MLRIDQIRLLPGDSEELLRGKCAKLLRVPTGDVTSCTVLRKAIDAREGLTIVYTAAVAVRNEAQVLRRCEDIYRQAAEHRDPMAQFTLGRRCASEYLTTSRAKPKEERV